jgi:predicted ester cyclase
MTNANTLRRLFDLMDQKNHSAIQELLGPGFSATIGGNPPMDAEQWAGMGTMFYAAFPDGKHTIAEAIDVGSDRVFLRGSFTGTNTGSFMGMPPTGRKATVTFMNFDRFADGKLVEHRAEVDMFGLMQQLGAVPGR